jgi:hypothetical protein
MTRRWRFSDFTLRMKFVLPITAILIGAMLILSGFLIQRQSEGFQRELESNGETIIKILAINAESGVLFESPYELDALLGTLHLFGSVEFCQIKNLEGSDISSIGQCLVADETINGLRDRGRSSMELVTDYFIDREESPAP